MKSGVAEGQPLEEHFVSLHQRMSPFTDKLLNLPNQMRAMISITGWVENDKSPLHFSAGALCDISSYGIRLEFDIYYDED